MSLQAFVDESRRDDRYLLAVAIIDPGELVRLRKLLLGKPSTTSLIIHEHVPSSQEPLLWIVDVVAWCYGAGGEWRRRVAPLVARVIDLDTWSG